MNLRRVAAVASKEWREIVRDRMFLALTFLVPVSLMLVVGYGLSLDVEDIPLAIVDRDGTNLSREYAYRYIDSRYFDFKGYALDVHDLSPLLADNKIRAAIILPENFQKELLGGRPVVVQTLIDGTFPFRAQTTKGYVLAMNTSFSSEVLASYISKRRGIPLAQAATSIRPVTLEARYLYNQSMKSDWAIAPRLIMVILMMTPPFYTALGIVREKERGSIYNIYSSTVTRLEFLIGKLIPYVGISSANAVILWLIATQLFGAPFKGSLLFFIPATLLYIICTTGLGLVVSVLVRTQVAAMVVTFIVTVIPSILYSGVIVPISSLSPTAQMTAHGLPAMYYTNIIVGTFMKGVGLRELWPDVLVLAFYAAGLMTIGYRMFHKRPST
ncbi:response regulator receiver domain protein (CheY-like) [Rhodopirellula islandica]|uniref:Transport permease protein n=1 Tax=Rhodopirellula islandica TaxID=595434 RepID=A0A0J1BFK5_RHOIS|nr:ABC transporter permease [Rhodopirellula islandica]KLU05335.1 response regulator receiver domain protein (CheY-like) [Rhodopirellula islandica]